jgi:hypothetical protein
MHLFKGAATDTGRLLDVIVKRMPLDLPFEVDLLPVCIWVSTGKTYEEFLFSPSCDWRLFITAKYSD